VTRRVYRWWLCGSLERGISVLTFSLTLLFRWAGERSKDALATWLELRRLEAAARKKKSCQQKLAQVRRYEAHCAHQGLPAYPMTYQSVGTYMVVFVRRNNGSAKSVGNVKSQLRTTAESRGLEWLSKSDARELTELIAELRLEDHAETDRKKPLTTDLLALVVDQLDLMTDADLLEATLVTTGHDGLLRGGELCSGLRKEDFLWWADRAGVSVFLLRTKTHRSGGAVKVDLVDHDSTFSAVKLLRQWWERRGLGEMPDHTIVFPNVVGRHQRMGDGTVSLDWLRHRIKTAVAKLGLDPKRYSGHSMRAGGATDLFVARVPYFIIKRMGRWTSDAAMVYYRAEEDVRQSVRSAFSKMARACGAGLM
jgi:hypothetical protein